MWEIEGFEFLKGSFHYEKSQPYRLWYEYLRLSTIYFQAHKERTSKGGLTEQEIKELPDDFVSSSTERPTASGYRPLHHQTSCFCERYFIPASTTLRYKTVGSAA